jgi:hypothetical protein
MPGVPRELVEHALNVDPKARPVKQPLRRFDEPKRKAIAAELHRLENAGFIREIKASTWVTRVKSTNVQDEGLRIGGRGRRMNSKVKISQTRRVSRISLVLNLAQSQSQSVPSRPLLAPIYRWPGLKEPVGFNTNYSIPI